MNIIFSEKIVFSDEEQKAFDLVLKCAHGIIRESKSDEKVKSADKFACAWMDFMESVAGG